MDILCLKMENVLKPVIIQNISKVKMKIFASSVQKNIIIPKKNANNFVKKMGYVVDS